MPLRARVGGGRLQPVQRSSSQHLPGGSAAGPRRSLALPCCCFEAGVLARAPRRTGSARCPAPRCARGVRLSPRVQPACRQRLRQRGSGRAQVALCALAGARVRHGRVAERGRAARRGRARPGPPPAPARLPGAAPPAPAPPVHAPEPPAGGRALGPSAGVHSLAACPVAAWVRARPRARARRGCCVRGRSAER